MAPEITRRGETLIVAQTPSDAPTGQAPGWPGISPRWTSSAKQGVGTAASNAGRVWFTVSHGILNEVFSPRLDQACIRDMGILVSDGRGFFSEEKRHTDTAAGHPR